MDRIKVTHVKLANKGNNNSIIIKPQNEENLRLIKGLYDFCMRFNTLIHIFQSLDNIIFHI